MINVEVSGTCSLDSTPDGFTPEFLKSVFSIAIKDHVEIAIEIEIEIEKNE